MVTVNYSTSSVPTYKRWLTFKDQLQFLLIRSMLKNGQTDRQTMGQTAIIVSVREVKIYHELLYYTLLV